MIYADMLIKKNKVENLAFLLGQLGQLRQVFKFPLIRLNNTI